MEELVPGNVRHVRHLDRDILLFVIMDDDSSW